MEQQQKFTKQDYIDKPYLQFQTAVKKMFEDLKSFGFDSDKYIANTKEN